MRYGDRADRGALDRRLVEAGLGVTVAVLVEVFADHHSGVPMSSTCPCCGYRYPDGVSDCPTNATVRPLLKARRHEDQKALERLTRDQFDDLRSEKTARTNRVAAKRASQVIGPKVGEYYDPSREHGFHALRHAYASWLLAEKTRKAIDLALGAAADGLPSSRVPGLYREGA